VTQTLHPSAKGVAALYCLGGDLSWLTHSYLSIYPCVERVYFFLSSSPWYGDNQAAVIDPSVLSALPDPVSKKEVVQGAWTNEVEQRNFTLAFAQYSGFSHGLIVDADEVYESAHLAAALTYAKNSPDISVWHVNWFTYWKSPQHRIDPIEPYQPPILATLGQTGFAETRNVVGEKHELLPPQICMCHHLSYALSDEALMKKHIMQPGHPQSAYPDWLQTKWRAWDTDHSIENLHPVHPPWFQRTIRQPDEALPSILKRVKWPCLSGIT
jgi:hypothetical protein